MTPLPEPLPATIPGAVQFDLRATSNGRTYRIYVYAPPGEPPAAGWPVVWLTDGDVSFGVAAGQMWLRAGSELRPSIVVGVGYGQADQTAWHWARAFDFTPPTPPDRRPAAYGPDQIGGAEGFLAFLTDELRPALSERFHIDPSDQSLFGYSLGGLFVLDTLFRRPHLFKTYLACSASIWWGAEWVRKEEAQFLSTLAATEARPRLLLTAGALEETLPTWLPGADSEALIAHHALVESCAMIRRARNLAAGLQAAAPDLDVRFTLIDGEGHGGGGPAAIVRGLEFALALTPPTDPRLIRRDHGDHEPDRADLS